MTFFNSTTFCISYLCLLLSGVRNHFFPNIFDEWFLNFERTQMKLKYEVGILEDLHNPHDSLRMLQSWKVKKEAGLLNDIRRFLNGFWSQWDYSYCGIWLSMEMVNNTEKKMFSIEKGSCVKLYVKGYFLEFILKQSKIYS